jgi:integrase
VPQADIVELRTKAIPGIFLLLTGQRRGEVAGMLWSELRDLSTENAVWEIPGHRTKNKHTHLVPLQPKVRSVLLTSRSGEGLSPCGKIGSSNSVELDLTQRKTQGNSFNSQKL